MASKKTVARKKSTPRNARGPSNAALKRALEANYKLRKRIVSLANDTRAAATYAARAISDLAESQDNPNARRVAFGEMFSHLITVGYSAETIRRNAEWINAEAEESK